MHTRIHMRNGGNGIAGGICYGSYCCSNDPFQKGQGSMRQRCSFREGVAFLLLMLSASAMGSDNIAVPSAGCIVSAVLLLLDATLLSAGKKKGPATHHSYRT